MLLPLALIYGRFALPATVKSSYRDEVVPIPRFANVDLPSTSIALLNLDLPYTSKPSTTIFFFQSNLISVN